MVLSRSLQVRTLGAEEKLDRAHESWARGLLGAGSWRNGAISRARYRAHKNQRAGVVSNFRQSAGNIRQYPANPLLPNIAERCRTLPDVSSGNIRQYPAIFLQNPAKSGKIRQYPAISGNIRQYPVPAAPHAISGNLRQYPAISGNLRQYPAISGSIADCLISGCLCPLVACTPDWGADFCCADVAERFCLRLGVFSEVQIVRSATSQKA